MFLSVTATALQKSNVYWPAAEDGTPMHAKSMASFAKELQKESIDYENKEILAMKEFVKRNQALNHSIIISSENFDQISVAGISVLYNMLKGFEVKIIFVYREMLSHLITYHFQANHHQDEQKKQIESFYSFFPKNFEAPLLIVDPIRLLRLYEDVFGKQSIVVIDLFGCVAAGVDVTYTIVCEVAGALCHRDDLFKRYSTARFNVRQGSVNTEIYTYYSHFLEAYGSVALKKKNSLLFSEESSKISIQKCHICDQSVGALKKFDDFLEEQRATKALPAIPFMSTQMTRLVLLAETVDRNLRSEFGDRILHGNATANMNAIQSKVHTDLIDETALLKGAEWKAWMVSTFKNDMKNGKLCSCNK